MGKWKQSKGMLQSDFGSKPKAGGPLVLVVAMVESFRSKVMKCGYGIDKLSKSRENQFYSATIPMNVVCVAC